MKLIKVLIIILLLQSENTYAVRQQQDGAAARWVKTRALRLIPFYTLRTPLPVYNQQSQEDPLNPSSVCCTVSVISVSILCAGIGIYCYYFS